MCKYNDKTRCFNRYSRVEISSGLKMTLTPWETPLPCTFVFKQYWMNFRSRLELRIRFRRWCCFFPFCYCFFHCYKMFKVGGHSKIIRAPCTNAISFHDNWSSDLDSMTPDGWSPGACCSTIKLVKIRERIWTKSSELSDCP